MLEERARLARELHDAVSQKLFSIRAKARAAAVLVPPGPGAARRPRWRASAELGGQAHAELRAVIDGLAPPDLAAGGLAGSLRSYAVLAGRTHGVQVRFDAAADLPALGAEPEAAVYRVAQEALHNALRHSGRPAICVSPSARRRTGSCWRSPTTATASPRMPRSGGLGPGLDAGAGRGGRRHADRRSAPGAERTVRLERPA